MSYTLKSPDLLWKSDDTPESTAHGDIYYPAGEGIAAAQHVFLTPNRIPDKWQSHSGPFTIGELGFGTGLNFFLTLKEWHECPDKKATWLHFISCEKHPLKPEDIEKALLCYPELSDLTSLFLSKLTEPLAGVQRIPFHDLSASLTLLYGDAAETLAKLDQRSVVDAWYLDGFAPGKNPEMWASELISLMSSLSAPGATFGTFTAAGHVRRSFEESGFEVTKFKGFAGKRESICGKLSSEQAMHKKSNPLPRSAALIGGGLAAACLAESLTRRGIEVHILEKQSEIALGASGNPAGILLPYITLSPTIPSRFYLKAFQYALNSYPEELLNRKPILHFPSTQRLEKLLKKFDQTELSKNIAHVVTPSFIKEQFQIESPSSAFLYPNGAWVRPREICNHLTQSSSLKNHIAVNTEALSFTRENEQWHVFDSDQSEIISTDILILTNAYDCQQFDQSSWLPVEPVRGQLIRTKEQPFSKDLSAILCYDGYCLPADNGFHTLGATYDHHNLTAKPLESDTQTILKRIQQWCPEFRFESATFARVAFRTTTYDRFPLLGKVPDFERAKERAEIEYINNLYVATGFGSRGLISCPLAAEILSAEICGEVLPVDEDIYRALQPERYMKRCIERDSWSS